MTENKELETLRHSASHIMAEAVKALYPDVKLAIGPAIDTGFYYDFDMPHHLTEEDLPKIEEKMAEIIKKNEKFVRSEVSKPEAEKKLQAQGEQYKLELAREIPDNMISFYKNGSFEDMCRGPHVHSTGEVKAFKLLSIAGAYWRGSEKNKMLQRIYGTAFASKQELEDHLKFLEEAEKRDHRKLGKQLDLFNIFQEEAGAGLVYWYPKGTVLRGIIEDFLKAEHKKRGYEMVMIPHLAKIDLWHTSGHSGYYMENMYKTEIEEKEYIVKPMNCPGHILIWKRTKRSYRDLPIRYFELGTVYRNEKSGVLHGLLRVRGFTQDDAHIFCRHDQVQEEISKVLDFVFDMMKVFGFKYEINLSTRPEKFVGTKENWEHATNALIDALKAKGETYVVDEGAGVFYGPKIDIKLKDAIGRLWQGPTIQVDFNLPERFDLTYTGEDGKEHRPAMIHRVVLGSIERFIGALIEHYAGAFPLWLSPVQVAILPIADRHAEYAEKLKKELEDDGIRVEVDSRREKIGAKIRDAEMQKTPYMLIVGDKDIAAGTVSVRVRHTGDIGAQKLDEFTKGLKEEIAARK
jgi:threonyl-tRNA synthetase